MAANNSNTSGSEDKAKAKTEKVVRYTGSADVRKIGAASWSALGVEDQGQVTWDRRNGFTVKAADLQKGALRHLDENDADFTVEDVEV